MSHLGVGLDFGRMAVTEVTGWESASRSRYFLSDLWLD
jgi:hypothetical protein